MDKTPAFYIVLGLLIGAIFGLGVGAANGNAIRGMELGALAGVFIGWFLVAAVLESGKKQQ